MKKIVIVRQKYTAFGGAERFINRVMNALIQQGVSVSVLTRQWGGGENFTVRLIRVFYLGRLWRDKSFARSVCRQLKTMSDCIVQSHERLSCCDIYRAGDGLHCEWLKQRSRIYSPLANWFTRLSPYHRYVKAAEASMFRSSRLKMVVCNSPMIKNELIEQFSLAENKACIIRNGVDNEKFHPDLRAIHRSSMCQALDIPKDAVVILTIGSGFERKGVLTLLKALANTTENTYLLVVGKTSHPERFKQLSRDLLVEKQVRFVGPQENPLPFYGVADVFALPAIYDPAPNVILEAMACALPIITSFKTGNWDLVSDFEAGFCCDALDDRAITGFIEALQSPLLRQRLGRNARQAILPWTDVRMAEDYQSLYDDIFHRR